LYELSIAKQRAIINIDIPKIDELTKAEESVLLESSQLTESRLKLVVDLAKSFGVALDRSAVKNISELIELLPQSEYKAKLSALLTELKLLAKEVVKINNQNKLLTENSLSLIRDFFKLISQDESASNSTYTKPGSKNYNKKEVYHNILLDRVA
jgi:flagellar biosynthesis/type III secretory pathway chaperone